MRVALLGLEPATARQLAAWLADEGHIARVVSDVQALHDRMRDEVFAAVFSHEQLSAEWPSEQNPTVVRVGDEAPRGDTPEEAFLLLPPFRRRVVLSMLP
ncbi:MAG: hypothetical protein AAF270_02070 [Pseudomonadota bacterium]